MLLTALARKGAAGAIRAGCRRALLSAQVEGCWPPGALHCSQSAERKGKGPKNAGEEGTGEVMAKLPEEEHAGAAEDAVGPYGHV